MSGGTGRSNAFSWRFTLPLFLGSTLNPINSSLIATALVPIAEAVHVPVGRTALLIAGVYLASAVAQPTAGKLAEVFGPRRTFITGILLVLAAGIIGGLGQDLSALIVARVLIGLGTSAGYPSAMVLIRRRAAAVGLSEPPGGVLGGLAVAGMAVAAVGLPLGGVLVGAAGWRSVFLVNIPVALIALAMVLTGVPADPRAGGERNLRELASRLDVGGITAFGATIVAALVFLLALPRADWIALAVAAASAGALVWWELRAATPFFDLRLLASNRALTRTYARMGLTMFALYSVMYGVSQWIEAGRHLSPEETGLVILPMALLAPVISFPVSRRNLVRGPLILTGVALLFGSAGLLLLTPHTPALFIAVVTLLFGVPMGLASVANQTALYAEAPAEGIGTAAGLFRTFAYIGSIASSAIIGVVFRNGASQGGLHTIAVVLIAASGLVLLITLTGRRREAARTVAAQKGPSETSRDRSTRTPQERK